MQKIIIDSILKEWKNDSLGCKGVRTMDKVNILADTFQLRSKYSDQVINILGKPNKIYSKDNVISIRYYSHSICDSSNNTVDSLVSCWVEFYFPDAKINNCKILPVCR